MVSHTCAATIMHADSCDTEFVSYVRIEPPGGLEHPPGVDIELFLEVMSQAGVFQRRRKAGVGWRIGQGDQAIALCTQRSQAVGDVGVRGHGAHAGRQRGEILVGDLYSVHIAHHPKHRLPEGEEVDVGV